MDPITIQRLGEVRQHDILAQTKRDRLGVPEYAWMHMLGRVLIALGESLIDATHPAFQEDRRSSTRLSH